MELKYVSTNLLPYCFFNCVRFLQKHALVFDSYPVKNQQVIIDDQKVLDSISLFNLAESETYNPCGNV